MWVCKVRTAFVFSVLVAATASFAGNLLPNPGFEDASSKEGIAEGWADNSNWADLAVTYALDTANPHSGRTCQRITCSRLTSGAVQMVPTADVPLRKGAIYRVRCWARGNAGNLAVQLRQAPAPYRIYIEQGLLTGPEWAKLEYLWTSDVDDPQARFMLRFTQAGTVWVDDVSVEELTPEEAIRQAPPTARGNLLHNGQFRLGIANWLIDHGCDYTQEATLAVERDGDTPCLKLSVPEGIAVWLASDAVPLSPGRVVLARCRVRAATPTPVTFTTHYCGTQATAGTDWQALQASGTVGFQPQTSDCVRLNVRGPATVWIADVQLRQDGATEGADHQRAAMIADRHPLSLYHDGESAPLKLMSTTPPGTRPAEIVWRVEDFWGRTRRQGRWLPPAGDATKTIRGDDLGRGWYRATVIWTSEGRTLSNESTLCILPPEERHGDAALSPFGSHFALDPTGIRLAKAVGVRWLRLHPPNHTKWRIVEPKQGEWQWRDEAIRIARQAGFTICGSLDRLPTWASTAPPGLPEWDFYNGSGAYMPRDWSQWERYVAETVRRYQADIQVWEIWNEPNLTDWLVPPAGQTRAQAYTEYLKHTYPIVKRENPSATVIGGVIAGPLTKGSDAEGFLKGIIDAGGLPFLDILSYHDYIAQPVDENPDPVDAWMPRVHRMLQAHGKDVPIINSEGGFANPGTCITYRPAPADTVPSDRMARWLVRQYVSQIAAGAGRFFLYNMFVDGSPITQAWEGFVEGDGQPRPNVAAYATMTWLLDGATFERTERPNADTWVHRFRTPRGPLLVTWRRTGKTGRMIVRGAVGVWDLMGAPVKVGEGGVVNLTDAPVYILTKQ